MWKMCIECPEKGLGPHPTGSWALPSPLAVPEVEAWGLIPGSIHESGESWLCDCIRLGHPVTWQFRSLNLQAGPKAHVQGHSRQDCEGEELEGTRMPGTPRTGM